MSNDSSQHSDSQCGSSSEEPEVCVFSVQDMPPWGDAQVSHYLVRPLKWSDEPIVFHNESPKCGSYVETRICDVLQEAPEWRNMWMCLGCRRLVSFRNL